MRFRGVARSQEICCQDDLIKSCVDIVEIDPSVVDTRESINILGVDFDFSNEVPPNGFTYKTKDGGEAILSYNPQSGNMFGSVHMPDGSAYGLEKCQFGYVWKEFDMDIELGEFIPEKLLAEEENYNYLDNVDPQSMKDNNSMVTYSVMFYYTAEFEKITQDINGWIDQVLCDTNQGYINSQIPLRVEK